MSNLEPVQRRDYLWIGLFTAALFGIVLAAGGPLTMHEGVLSQTTRAMLANHDWLVPRYGEAPWLERPPLPQWISCAICAVIGHGNEEWNIRIGSALAGLTTVLLTVWLAGRFYGRAIGILSGLALATMYNFIRYSTLAEADIYLAPIVAGTLCAFAHAEILRPRADSESSNFVGKRPWSVLAFFALLGMTNLAKGIVFGTVIAAMPVVGYVLWNASSNRLIIFLILLAWALVAKLFGLGTLIGMGPLALYLLGNIWLYKRYVWLWGWLAFAAVALPWPIAVCTIYPDAIDLWRFDLIGRLSENYLGEPPWYYLECLHWVPQPWTIAAGIGLCVTWRSVTYGTRPLTLNPSPLSTGARGDVCADRFVWCWAWLPMLVFSLADGKHHHYMLHYLAPWAILAAKGTVWAWNKLAERRAMPRPEFAMIGGFACLFLIYGVGFVVKGAYLHRSRDDTEFLYEARRAVPLDQPLLINSAGEALEGLRMQFYMDERSYFLHNLSFMLDERIGASDVYVVTRYNRRPELEKYGRVEMLQRCKHSRREADASERFTLFRVHLRDDLPRKSAQVRISPLQAMYRAPGPTLDPREEK